MIRVRLFHKKWSRLNGLRLLLSDLKIVDIRILLNVDNYVSCHVTLGISRNNPNVEKFIWTFNVRYNISSEKTKVSQFARLCRIMTCVMRYALNQIEIPRQHSQNGENVIAIRVIVISSKFCFLCKFSLTISTLKVKIYWHGCVGVMTVINHL